MSQSEPLRVIYNQLVTQLYDEKYIFTWTDIDRLEPFKPDQPDNKSQYFLTLRNLYNSADDALVHASPEAVPYRGGLELFKIRLDALMHQMDPDTQDNNIKAELLAA